MSEKNQVVTDHGAAAAPAPKQKAIARHCKRFWWIYLIAFIVGAVLIVVVTIFAVVPKIAQSKMNAAKLEIQGVNILKTTSGSYVMEVNSTIRTDGSIHAHIDSFTGDMYLEDLEPHTPFATLEFPATTADKFQMVNISQEITITDHDAFNTFNIQFFQKETLRVTLKGKTKVKPRGLNRKYGVTFKKTLDMSGLNLLKGTEVTGGHISTDADVKWNFNGTSVIHNPSHFTLDLGNVTFRNFVEDEDLGTLEVQNFLLVPGANDVDIRASLNQIAVLGYVREDAYCKTGVVPFKLEGSSVVNHGENLTYFAAALSSANQTVPIDIGAIIKADLGTTLGCASDTSSSSSSSSNDD